MRDFDNYATLIVGNYKVKTFGLFVTFSLMSAYYICCFLQTVDTYYRRCSSAGYVGNVMDLMIHFSRFLGSATTTLTVYLPLQIFSKY